MRNYRGYLQTDAYSGYDAPERGGHAATTMYSLIGTCKLNGVGTQRVLTYVLRRLPDHRTTHLGELLPFNWKPRRS